MEAAREHQLCSIELKVRDLLKTEVALLRGTVKKVKVVAEEALGGGERKVPSAPEMEELGRDEGVVPEALAPPVLKSCPVVVSCYKITDSYRAYVNYYISMQIGILSFQIQEREGKSLK